MSGNLAIKAEDVSKLYRLGQVGTGTLQQDLKRWWWNFRGKEDPFTKIGETNDRTTKGSSEYVWALKDINFEVQKGEVLGIIGRNGAGKSTLLKILSKTTSPTSGSIKIDGRIASLLEVGTGFHPELTGRENIFLNGAILGMTKKEIRSKFDEIVDFSGVERYIDTPVKRYSSGMYVRLAFAVAAHLEPEVLVVDEVLAVGDVEFQKKCLGKMKDVSVNDGRTVLFVSHNMTAIRNLCDKGIYFKNGGVDFIGGVEDCVNRYLLSDTETINVLSYTNKTSDSYIKEINIESSDINIYVGDEITINLNLELKGYSYLNIDYGIYNKEGELVTIISSKYNDKGIIDNDKGTIKCVIPKNPLVEGIYYINVFLSNDKGGKVEYIEKCLQFEVINGDFYGNNRLPSVAVRSKFLMDHYWK